MARAFDEKLGVKKGDRVAILASNCPEWIVSFWAAICLGAVPVALNGWWAGDEIRFALEDCTPKLLIADEKRLQRLGNADMPVVSIEHDFAPQYLIPLDKRKVVKELKEAAAKASDVYLATDPDRESVDDGQGQR